MSRQLNFVNETGTTVVQVTFSKEIRFDGHVANLPHPRTTEQEETLRRGITLMNTGQADIEVDGKRVAYLFQ